MSEHRALTPEFEKASLGEQECWSFVTSLHLPDFFVEAGIIADIKELDKAGGKHSWQGAQSVQSLWLNL